MVRTWMGDHLPPIPTDPMNTTGDYRALSRERLSGKTHPTRRLVLPPYHPDLYSRPEYSRLAWCPDFYCSSVRPVVDQFRVRSYHTPRDRTQQATLIAQLAQTMYTSRQTDHHPWWKLRRRELGTQVTRWVQIQYSLEDSEATDLTAAAQWACLLHNCSAQTPLADTPQKSCLRWATIWHGLHTSWLPARYISRDWADTQRPLLDALGQTNVDWAAPGGSRILYTEGRGTIRWGRYTGAHIRIALSHLMGTVELPELPQWHIAPGSLRMSAEQLTQIACQHPIPAHWVPLESATIAG